MIEVRNLHKNFGAQPVLTGVNLRVAKAQSAVVLGRSGCGKSVLLKLIIGLIAPEAGEVLIDGQSLRGMSERQLLEVRRKFGMLFQGAALFDSLTVFENVGFALLRENRRPRADIQQQVKAALARVELEGIEDKKPAQLSGGMRKRVGLARAIIYHPQILLYDEPTTGLDPVGADRIDRLILRVTRQLQATSVIVTHDLRTARRVGQQIHLLHEGRIHFSGSPEETFQSEDPVVKYFVAGQAEPDTALAPE